MSSKPWQNQELPFLNKAILVLDNAGSRAAACAGTIIKTFGCQAARATNEREFMRLLVAAKHEHCEIVGIIADDSMEVRGNEIIDRFSAGYYAKYYQPSNIPDASTTAFLIITGDHDLNYRGEAGVEKTLVFHLGAWNEFLKNPKESAVGILIGSWLGVEQKDASTIVSREISRSRAAGQKGIADYMEARRDAHDSENVYLMRAKEGIDKFRPK